MDAVRETMLLADAKTLDTAQWGQVGFTELQCEVPGRASHGRRPEPSVRRRPDLAVALDGEVEQGEGDGEHQEELDHLVAG